MLKREEFVHIGKFLKPHGTKGEIGLQTGDFELGDDCDFVACDIDGILVPFFFEYCRTKNNDAVILKIEKIDSAEGARFLTNRDVYIPREWVESEENLSWSFFKGFKAYDDAGREFGVITDVDDSTINTLFVIEKGSDEFLIPAREEFITSLDPEKREIIFTLPEGLASL